MEEDIVKLLREQERILGEMRSNLHRWMDELLREAFNPEIFLRYVAGMGIDLSQVPNLVGRPDGIDPYRVLGLDKTATDDEVKKRYHERVRQFHPDTAGPGMEFHFQCTLTAYELIKRERGWQ